MYYSIKTLLAQGKSQRAIAKELGIHRQTVRQMAEKIARDELPDRVRPRGRHLDEHRALLKRYLDQGLTAVLIQDRLSKNGIVVAYSTLTEYLRTLRHQEVYVPVHSDPGEEAQVDFGYLGYFRQGTDSFKVWVFCMVLSHSRYAYYEVVRDQSVGTFIQAHINAFEYFGGVPQTVKIDNLKAGVLEASFYEPVIQKQYAEFLAHYQSQPLTARIARGQDKGKVESGVKYIKGNFLRGLTTRSFELLQKSLVGWNAEVCNVRVHGTTRKVPSVVFEQVEKPVLQPLPEQRYLIFQVERRKVNNYGHIRVKGSYYSVPYLYVGKEVFVQYNQVGLRIYVGTEEIALHPWAPEEGSFVTREEHKAPYKQARSAEEYQRLAEEKGTYIGLFSAALHQQNPRSWKNMMRGIFHLTRVHSCELVEAACQKAHHYQTYSYQTVKHLCKLGIRHQEIEQEDLAGLGGYGLDLKAYDQLFTP